VRRVGFIALGAWTAWTLALWAFVFVANRIGYEVGDAGAMAIVVSLLTSSVGAIALGIAIAAEDAMKLQRLGR